MYIDLVIQHKPMKNTSTPKLEVSPSYIKQMQSDGMYDALEGKPAQNKTCPYYMEGYYSAKQ